MKRNWRKILISASVCFVIFFIFAWSANATENTIRDSVEQGTISGYVAEFMSWIALLLVQSIGYLMTWVMKAVLALFKMQEFEADGVKVGWTILRDVCNMFFILVLLLIAFATILRMENYSMKKYLPKLLLMAVLINFSKTICLLLIDISQVVMLTFANAFATAGDGNFVSMLGLQNLLLIRETVDVDIQSWAIFGAIMLALVFSVLVVIIMVMFMVMLLGRLIMFWILIILSPIAFFSTAVPGMGKYWSQWWGEFSKYLVAGPVLAFFTWLALTIQKTAGSFDDNLQMGSKLVATGDQAKAVEAAISQIGSGQNMMKFIMGIGLLLGALKITQSMGGIGTSVGTNLANKVKNKGMSLGRGAVNRISNKASDITGISGAREYLKQRKVNRDNLRTQRIETQAGMIAGGMQFAKEKTVGWAGKKVNAGWRKLGGGAKADELQKHLPDKQKNLSDLQAGDGPEFTRIQEQVEKLTKFETSDRKTVIKDRDNKWHVYKSDNTYDRPANEKDIEDAKLHVLELERAKREKVLDAEIIRDKEDIDKYTKRQKIADNVARYGLGGIFGAAGGVYTGGFSLIPLLLGATAGTFGVKNVQALKSASEVGSVDKKLVSSYRMNRINKEREGKKNDSDTELITKLDDKTADVFERAACAMELMSKKKLSAVEIHLYREELQKKLGGTREEGGIKYWKDKKLNNQFEALASNVPGASYQYIQAKNGDERAKYDIEQDIAAGRVNMNDLSISTIQEIIGQLAKGMKDEKFKKSYLDMTDHMQKAIVKALKDNGTYEAKAKIAWVKDMKEAFGAGATKLGDEAHKFLRQLSEEEINNIMSKGTDGQRAAMIEKINGNGALLSSTFMEGQSARAKTNRQLLGVKGPND